jgi:hypothetical protein
MFGAAVEKKKISMGLIDKILSSEIFRLQPPVLIDIGASGKIHQKWKRIAKYAICIAFDADERDFTAENQEKSKYKKLLIKRNLVSEQAGQSADFYLTQSPHCSSLLEPDSLSLKDWAYSPIFTVEKTEKLTTTDINTTLTEFGITYIDWYKSDSQGIDLRLFKSIDAAIRNKIAIAEFEPGILDAYQQEDKLADLLSYQDAQKTFWLADLQVKGPIRMPHEKLTEVVPNPLLQKVLGKVGNTAPGWTEMTFCNQFKNPEMLNQRSLMIGWISATLIGQHGFAYTLADKGLEQWGNTLFQQMKKTSAQKLRSGFFSFRYLTWLLNKLS